ncbi:ribbon-helix-helix protein, CopG family [Novosphingobium olei]|uniref:Ribbon-helix-helix protein, CopG family n=1 Tax=Novosphingobium olei TaxID=2728851 RepID=A0A7Y0BNN6_9SPHN|nr:ribbon-helix-helix protein, CopG family [Novosphingobium olei]NML93750.1 ribbon-helix-helix protein, CopG family [Novosphingobium olei]
MTRILADLSDEDIKWLDARAAEQGTSRAALVREAVASFKALSPASGSKDWIQRGAGYWKDRADVRDGVNFQRAIRQDRRSYDDL